MDLAEAINAFVRWLVQNYGETFEAISQGLLSFLLFFEGLLRDLSWFWVAGLVFLAGWWLSRRLVFALGMGLGVWLIEALGLWDKGMQTLALVLAAVAVSVIIGLPLGILMGRSDRFRGFMLPILDAMQTMPSFVYLIPALLLFGLGKVPALIATVIYAVPPMIRLTDLGLRMVQREVMEAAEAFGATSWQRLLKVELPLALPNLLAGLNQTTMMALAMVVIASMIGARGLGEEVLLGIQRLDVGRGAVAGVAIVALAIVLDRLIQAAGQRAVKRYREER
ncbi:ABC transporter permease [Meiothermus ruber]|jgi:glycine betaine/proline transport system permease protein|uniref:Binding-protein-dependent transport system inner membrane protein n=1 Tax=Meiothermus ruber (strain ATCC 35948 / DSM 1279 / VKM B-1258 / 21) TaxID=504728 RepID=D3PRG3_MEIRD|nr:ABC transporter permease subunit [Meiothermus ruber]ADD28046.1 binding-protein-dependent transport systems inner membrane component [Meiothermus ruber DSM 1279]AGK04516.1 binding-protein-dependent transport system inner membrane protein [Meiothermus ruber DSM 1279]MCL6528758.1 ABC transporter permease subunit [Meiothermus ruber]MCX7801678.1 ABC transporter permease subunit [Meiothermus ruber]GAO74992.1 binding-protein-dependent transport system inner membrane protein [Meiothermus ruber H328